MSGAPPKAQGARTASQREKRVNERFMRAGWEGVGVKCTFRAEDKNGRSVGLEPQGEAGVPLSKVKQKAQPSPHPNVQDVHAPAVSWCASRGWTPQPFQLEVWESMARRRRLVASAHCAGRPMCHGPRLVCSQGVGPRGKGRRRLLWIAPFRELTSDISEAARAMVVGLGLDWDVGRRTGDT